MRHAWPRAQTTETFGSRKPLRTRFGTLSALCYQISRECVLASAGGSRERCVFGNERQPNCQRTDSEDATVDDALRRRSLRHCISARTRAFFGSWPRKTLSQTLASEGPKIRPLSMSAPTSRGEDADRCLHLPLEARRGPTEAASRRGYRSRKPQPQAGRSARGGALGSSCTSLAKARSSSGCSLSRSAQRLRRIPGLGDRPEAALRCGADASPSGTRCPSSGRG